MKKQFWLLHRNGVFYLKNSLTRQKTSLHTRNRREALRLRAVHNKAAQTSALGLAFAKAYLSVRDPDFAKRTWQHVMDCFCAQGKPQTQEHRKRIASHHHFDRIRSKSILETTADDFLKILKVGGDLSALPPKPGAGTQLAAVAHPAKQTMAGAPHQTQTRNHCGRAPTNCFQ